MRPQRRRKSIPRTAARPEETVMEAIARRHGRTFAGGITEAARWLQSPEGHAAERRLMVEDVRAGGDVSTSLPLQNGNFVWIFFQPQACKEVGGVVVGAVGVACQWRRPPTRADEASVYAWIDAFMAEVTGCEVVTRDQAKAMRRYPQSGSVN